MIVSLLRLHKKIFVSTGKAGLSQGRESVVAVLVYLTVEILSIKEVRKVPDELPLICLLKGYR